MKINILNRTKFLKHLDNSLKAIASNNLIPSLDGLLITASESNIILISSNGTLSIKEEINEVDVIEIKDPGKILVPGKMFKEIISKQNDLITLTANKTKMIIESQGANTTLNLMNEEDYPVLNFDIIGNDLYVNCKEIKKAIRNVSFAASENDKRIILNGVNLTSNGNHLIATATNSFRLAQESIQIENEIDCNITIVSKSLASFIPFDVDEDIKIKIGETSIITKHKNTTLSSRLIDGVYPEVSRLIPTEFKSVLEIDSKEILNVIERVAVVSNDSKKIVRLTLSSNELSLESKKDEVGEAKVLSNNFNFSGEDVQVVFNSQFFKDAVKRFSGTVKIGIVGSDKPIVIKGSSNKELIQLVLPHRTY